MDEESLISQCSNSWSLVFFPLVSGHHVYFSTKLQSSFHTLLSSNSFAAIGLFMYLILSVSNSLIIYEFSLLCTHTRNPWYPLIDKGKTRWPEWWISALCVSVEKTTSTLTIKYKLAPQVLCNRHVGRMYFCTPKMKNFLSKYQKNLFYNFVTLLKIILVTMFYTLKTRFKQLRS